MPTIKDVRDFLNGLSDQRVPADSVQKQIDVATTKILAIKSAQATTKQVEDATLLLASYLTYGAYATEVEKALGTVPAQISAHLSLLKQLSDDFISLISRGTPTVYTMVAQPDTLLDQYDEGDLDGDVY